jgi:hypothetical protein
VNSLPAFARRQQNDLASVGALASVSAPFNLGERGFPYGCQTERPWRAKACTKITPKRIRFRPPVEPARLFHAEVVDRSLGRGETVPG